MTATTTPTLELNNGVQMPALGLGVFQTPEPDTITLETFGREIPED